MECEVENCEMPATTESPLCATHEDCFERYYSWRGVTMPEDKSYEAWLAAWQENHDEDHD